MKRKILLISYHYPPSMAVGGLRLANFARYLPDHGWQPYVLTIRDRYLVQLDHQRLLGLAQVPVFKTSKLPTVSDIYMTAKARLTGLAKKPAGDAAAQAVSAVSDKSGRLGWESAPQKLKRYIFSLLISLPDGERNWIVPAVWHAMRIIKRERVACILTSCPPYSVHLIGLILKLLTGVRWVADFRDPWITGSCKQLYYTSLLSMAIESRLEHLVLRKADSVLVNTAILTDLFRQAHPDLDYCKFAHLPNGFNPDLFAKYRGLEKFERFTITYTGSLYFGRSPEPLFESLSRLIGDGLVRPDRIRLKLVGDCSDIDGYATDRLIAKYGLADVVEVSPPVSHGRAMELIARSHIALLLAPSQPLQIPAKVFDYIGIGTPILALAGEGATADMIRSTGFGQVYSPRDIQGISGFVGRAFSQSPGVASAQNHDTLRKFDIRRIVEELAGRLNAACRLDAVDISN